MRPRLALLILTLTSVAAIALSGCLGERIETPTPSGHSDAHHPSAQQSSDTTITRPDETLHVEAGTSANELTFSPTTLHADEGKSIELVVHNNGTTPHTFTVHALSLNTGPLQPDQYASLKFRATTPGSFEIMCDQPGHYDAGMKATLEVA